jgi:hypothetical protein
MAQPSLIRIILGIALLASFSLPAHALITFKSTPWTDLSAEQKQILAPLARDWNSLDLQRQTKWLLIAQRYGSFTPDEKARMQERMKEWAHLSPNDRKLARVSFTSVQKVPAEQRGTVKDNIRQQWYEYQSLAESEKERLRSEGLLRSGKLPPTSAQQPSASGRN